MSQVAGEGMGLKTAYQKRGRWSEREQLLAALGVIGEMLAMVRLKKERYRGKKTSAEVIRRYSNLWHSERALKRVAALTNKRLKKTKPVHEPTSAAKRAFNSLTTEEAKRAS